MAGGFQRLHPARVVTVDPGEPSAPILVEVVAGWSLFAEAQPTTRIRTQLALSQWDELAGWSEDPCREGAAPTRVPAALQSDGGGVEEVGGAGLEEVEGANACGHGLLVGMVPRANFETMQDGMLTSFQL